MSRKPIGERAMTGAERQRKLRAKQGTGPGNSALAQVKALLPQLTQDELDRLRDELAATDRPVPPLLAGLNVGLRLHGRNRDRP